MKKLKKIFLQTVFLFGALQGLTGIVCGQQLTQNKDTCICYTDKQDKRAIECIINTIKKDSLIYNLNTQIKVLNASDTIKQAKINLINSSYNKKIKENQKLNLQLSKARKNGNLKLATGGAFGFILGILLFK